MFLEISMYIIVSVLISACLYFVIMVSGEKLVDAIYSKRKYINQQNDLYIRELQSYIDENNISSDNMELLDSWMDDNKQIYISIKMNGRWLYFSEGNEEIQYDVSHEMAKLPESGNYSIELQDGEAEVLIVGMYSYKAYMIVIICDLIVCVIAFFFNFMMLLGRKLKYIEKLCNAINILEGGNLDYRVEVVGRDELSELAVSLNDMRLSFQKQLQEIEELTETNREIVTELSHDLRTPLTAVLLYAEILKGNKFESDAKRKECIDKIVDKMEHMKKLSDKILEYASLSAGEQVKMDFSPVSGLLSESLSDFGCYIETQGFTVDTMIEKWTGNIFLGEEYLARILDNIASNLIKHADRKKKVIIKTEYEKDQTFRLVFVNGVAEEKCQNMDSRGIGLKNISSMMEKMGGKMDVEIAGGRFLLELIFQYAE